MDAFNRLSGRVSRILLIVGACILSAMMFLIMADVLLRYVFSKPISGAYEMVQYMMAIVIPFGIVYCAHEKGHVSVDVLFDLLPNKTKDILNCIIYLIVLVLFLLVAWQNISFVSETYKSGYTSPVLYVPAYPFVGTIAIGFTVLCLVLLIDFLNALLETVRK